MSCSANIVLDKRNQNHVVRDENGIIAKYLSDSLVLYANREGKDISAIPNMVYFDKGEEGLIRELFSSLDYSNEEYGGKVCLLFGVFKDLCYLCSQNCEPACARQMKTCFFALA